MESFTAILERSPELFPITLDILKDVVTLIRLSEAEYGGASFLDGRLLTSQTIARVLPFPQLEDALRAAHLTENCGFIFHIGHVGSTLLSRLLGAHRNMFALREPAILRTLAQLHFAAAPQSPEEEKTALDRRLEVFLKLWSRTFRPEQRAIVKATSFASELAPLILARRSRLKAIFMFVPAETYLASILGAPNSPQEALALSGSRLKRLHRRLGEERWDIGSLSMGEMVAMSWVAEMTALQQGAAVASDRAFWLNFNRFLADPHSLLASAFRHFGIEATTDQMETILSGPEMHHYSKAPEHPFDAKLRDDVLKQARGDCAAEIARGLDWLSQAAIRFPVMEPLLNMA